LGVVIADIDDDRDLDIYVANDTDDNRLYVNDGTGRFDEQGMISGTAVDDKARANGSMGVAVNDYNGDGRVDLCVANYEDESFALYHNNGGGLFSHVSSKTGIEAIGRLQVAFGTVSGDYDGDGDEDLIVSNGHVIHHPVNAPLRQEPLYLVNQGGSRFERAAIPSGGYLAQPHMGRGLAQGDLDGDGDLDLVFANSNEPSAVLTNQAEPHGRWLLIDLVGTVSPRDGAGAKVRLSSAQGEMIRHAYGGGSYLSASERSPHFGYPKGFVPTRLKVQWTSGRDSELTLTEADLKRQRVRVVE
jgi:enediyne biosynthesis protein E4